MTTPGALSRLNTERMPQRVRTAASSSSSSQLFTVQAQTDHFSVDTRKGGGDTSFPTQLHYYHHLPPSYLLEKRNKRERKMKGRPTFF
mmetsp:Transcript_25303/g.37105  ORF Transcript_25303/g.37105 Transcript_25303/m.37105 type:complete len:88 (-) Transcript_25303:252-515(-)